MKRQTSILVAAAFGLVVVLLVLKLILFLTAKPKVTADYVAEYNKFAHPQNYDPNENAAPYYQKAFDTFIIMPDALPIGLRTTYAGWPTDFNSNQQAILEKWLASNSQAFELFKVAVNKPYYWLERHAEDDNSIFNILLPELSMLRELTIALVWNAKLNASKGQFQSAFEDILDCYRAGNHKCHSNLLLVDQINGLEVKKAAIKTAFIILDKSKSVIGNKVLESFQNTLQTEIDNDSHIPSIQAEKFFLYDALQRIFLDDGKGTGRLYWQVCWGIVPPRHLSNGWQAKWPKLKQKMSCFIGPTRNETAGQIEKIIAISDQMMTKTPWQVKNEGRNYFTEIKNIKNKNLFLELGTLSIDPKGTFCLYYNTKVRAEASVAVLAILRFKADTGQFPETLNELVSKGYLRTIPQDPYSNGVLIYKLADGNFKLYSVGPNFKNDEGIDESTDIIFWPVKEM
jgi:hypothetical protein